MRKENSLPLELDSILLFMAKGIDNEHDMYLSSFFFNDS